MELNSEESQIHGNAQALKVCSLQAVFHTFWKAEPTVGSPTSINLRPIPLRHTLFPSIRLQLDLQDHAEASRYRGHLDLHDECYGIYPCKGRIRNARGYRLVKVYRYSHPVCKGGRARNSNFDPKYDHSVESGE